MLISSQLYLHARHNRILQEIAYDNQNILVLQHCTTAEQEQDKTFTNKDDASKSKPLASTKDIRCRFPDGKQYNYPNVLTHGTFCLIARTARLVQINLLEILASNCIPIIMADNIVMPFSEIIDWTLASVTIREQNLHSIAAILQGISMEKVDELQQHGKMLYEKYFKNIKQIIRTMLDELNDRIFPHLAKNYLQWNIPVTIHSAQNPLFLSLTAPRSQGFTAVVLTYDRIESLFTLIQKLSVVPSLQKILVIWNNQKKAPPHCKSKFLKKKLLVLIMCIKMFFFFLFQLQCFRKLVNR